VSGAPFRFKTANFQNRRRVAARSGQRPKQFGPSSHTLWEKRGLKAITKLDPRNIYEAASLLVIAARDGLS